MQMMQRPSHLVLEDGTVFPGRAVGAAGVAAGEACFTTASTGYEEAATDPSYVAQVLCFAYPLVGNYGVDPARHESDRVQAEAIVMRTARPEWAAWLEEQGVVAIAGVDTRALDRHVGVTEPQFVGAGPRVALLDFGAKQSIVNRLAQTGVEVAVLPGDW